LSLVPPPAPAGLFDDEQPAAAMSGDALSTQPGIVPSPFVDDAMPPPPPTDGQEGLGLTPPPPPNDGSLHGSLFDEHDDAAVPPPAPVMASGPSDVDLAKAWPAGIPQADVVLELLGGLRQVPIGLRKQTDGLLGSLNEFERSALVDGAWPLDPTPMRRALATRWRLEVAFETKGQATAVDAASTDALFTEIDAALAALVLPPGEHPAPVLQAHEAQRGVLSRYAVNLVDLLQKDSELAAKAAAAAAAKKYEAARARATTVTFSQEAPKDDAKRARALYIILAVTAVLTIGFHAWRLSGNAGVPAVQRSVPGLSSDGFDAVGTQQGAITITAKHGGPVDAKTVEEVKKGLEAKGQGDQVVQGEDGAVLIIPGHGAPPGAAAPQRK
jgi:hypothetical protein